MTKTYDPKDFIIAHGYQDGDPDKDAGYFAVYHKDLGIFLKLDGPNDDWSDVYTELHAGYPGIDDLDEIETIDIETDDISRVIAELTAAVVAKASAPKDDALTAAVADAMTGVIADDEPEISEERKAEIEAIRKQIEEEQVELKKLKMTTVADAVRNMRGGILLMAEAFERIEAAGLVGNMPPPMQKMIKNMMEIERDYQATLAGTATAEPEEEAVPDILKDFLTRAEHERAERLAEEEREREAAAAAARAAAVPTVSSDDDDDEHEGADPDMEERRRKAEEEAKKVDDFFNQPLF